jgi:hypothetical protein
MGKSSGHVFRQSLGYLNMTAGIPPPSISTRPIDFAPLVAARRPSPAMIEPASMTRNPVLYFGRSSITPFIGTAPADVEAYVFFLRRRYERIRVRRDRRRPGISLATFTRLAGGVIVLKDVVFPPFSRRDRIRRTTQVCTRSRPESRREVAPELQDSGSGQPRLAGA